MYIFSSNERRCVTFNDYNVIVGFVKEQRQDLEDIKSNILDNVDLYGSYDRASEIYDATVKEYEEKYSDKKRMIFYINGEEFADYDVNAGKEMLNHLVESIENKESFFAFY